MSLILSVLQLASVVALIGQNRCFFFLGEGQKADNVSEEAAKRLWGYLKEIKHTR